MHLGLSAVFAGARGPLSPSTGYRRVPYPQFSSADRMAVQGEGMSQMGGSGRRRVMAVAAVVLALCVVAPELAAPIGAATPTTTGTAASRPNGPVVLVARRRSRAAIRRARVVAYLKGHPKVAAKKLKAHPILYARALRRRGIPAKLPRQARAGAKRHKRKAHVSAKVRRRRAAGAAKKKHRRRAGAAAVAAKRHKKKKSKSSGYSLSAVDWLEIALLVLAPFAAVALLLYISDVRRRPRAPSRSKRRRSLVITPLNKS
jgi:hypothetical protein